MIKNKKLSVIITAAGNSTRLGKNISKQFILLKNKPLLFYSLEKFALLRNLIEIIIVTNDTDKTNKLLNDKAKYLEFKNIKVVIGGKLRQDSVYNGFCKVDPIVDLVIIHDVARPLFNIKDLEICIEKAGNFGAAIPAILVTDTVKKAKFDNDELIVEKTVNRQDLYLVQTPQVISYKLLANVYKSRDMLQHVSTDEAQMVELLGEKVYLVIGNKRNIKITYKEDLDIALNYLNDSEKIVTV